MRLKGLQADKQGSSSFSSVSSCLITEWQLKNWAEIPENVSAERGAPVLTFLLSVFSFKELKGNNFIVKV